MHLAHEIVDSLRAVGENLHTLIVEEVNFGNIDLLRELFLTQRPSLKTLMLSDIILTNHGLDMLAAHKIKSISISGLSVNRSSLVSSLKRDQVPNVV